MKIVKDLLNCPNCGAPIQDDICHYCGSVFLDWASIDMCKPTFVKIKDSNGYYRLLKIIPKSIRQTMDSNPTYCYADNKICQITSNYNYEIEAAFDCLPFKHPLAKGKPIYQLLIDPNKADDDTKRKFVEEEK